MDLCSSSTTTQRPRHAKMDGRFREIYSRALDPPRFFPWASRARLDNYSWTGFQWKPTLLARRRGGNTVGVGREKLGNMPRANIIGRATLSHGWTFNDQATMMHQSHAREVTCHFQGPASCTGPCDFTEKPFPSTGSSILHPSVPSTLNCAPRRDLLHPLICDRPLIPLCPTDDIIEEQWRFFFSLSPRHFVCFFDWRKYFPSLGKR